MFCKKCGTELENGQKFCPKCGQQIGVEIKPEKNFSMGQFASGIGKIEIAKNKLPVIIGAAVVICAAFVILLINVIIPNSKYNKAMKLYNNRNYSEAINVFEELGDYKNSTDMLRDSKYENAVSLYDRKEYKNAIKQFKALNGYRNSKEYVQNAAWEVLLDYYPYDKDMKGTVIYSYSSEDSTYTSEVSICANGSRNGLILQESTGMYSQKNVAIFIYKDKDEGNIIGLYSFFSTEMGVADFNIKTFKDSSTLDWSITSSNKSSSSDSEQTTIDSFSRSVDSIMRNVQSELRSNGLGVTLSDIGFTNC